MGHYILQIVIFQLSFLLIYDLLLSKETFFNYNRAYLLISPILAIFLPFLIIEPLAEVVVPQASILLPEVNLSNPTNASQGTLSAIKGISPIVLLYIAGLLISTAVVIIKIFQLRGLFRLRSREGRSNYKIVEVPSSRIACTFYKTIFVGDQLSEDERAHIIAHELIHVKQKHSLDLLLFEILKIVMWFNPLVYIYQKRIATLHEYIADASVVKNINKNDYFHQLLNSVFHTKEISFLNQFFNHSLIKKRIIMLNKSRSRKTSKFKFLVLIPLLLVMLTYVACAQSEEHTAVNSVASEETLKQENLESKKQETIEDIPFAVLDEAPIFPGCEGLDSNEERKKCFSAKITEFVTANFDSKIMEEDSKPGINRVIVLFKINSLGAIVNVKARASSETLKQEGIRVVSLLPDVKPGIKDGKVVNVLYSLPIVYKVDTEEKTD